jgi:DNA-binding response OmpR family regulator
MITILIVEHDEPVGRLIEATLESAGYTVYRAYTPADVYDVLRARRVAMVIAELNMPDGAGLDVIAMLRHDFPGTKIVGISGTASEFDPVQAAPLLESVEVLPNPIGITHLVGTVQRVLNSP